MVLVFNTLGFCLVNILNWLLGWVLYCPDNKNYDIKNTKTIV